MRRILVLASCTCGLLVFAARVSAQTAPGPGDLPAAAAPAPALSIETQDKAGQPPNKPSPWLLLPLVSSGPKMGTSFGGLGAYLHYFDPKSQVSMFGVMYQYSTTKSQLGALFARTSFAEDSQRLEGVLGYGYIRNEYKDYMGSGKTFRTTDEVLLGGGRYLFRVKGPWFIGAEGAFGDYTVEAETDLQNKALEILGLAGFQIRGRRAGPDARLARQPGHARARLVLEPELPRQPYLAGIPRRTSVRPGWRSRRSSRTAESTCSPCAATTSGPTRRRQAPSRRSRSAATRWSSTSAGT